MNGAVPFWKRAMVMSMATLVAFLVLELLQGGSDFVSAKAVVVSLVVGLAMGWWMPRMMK